MRDVVNTAVGNKNIVDASQILRKWFIDFTAKTNQYSNYICNIKGGAIYRHDDNLIA